jgi:hypothetical protein
MSTEIIPKDVKPGIDLALTSNEDEILRKIWKRRTFFILSAFLGCMAVLAFAFFRSERGLTSRNWQTGKYDIIVTREEFYRLGPILYSFALLILISSFLVYYFKSAHPFYKDRKKKSKEIIYLQPHTYKTPYFESYYLIMPLKKRKNISISKEMYHALEESKVAEIAISHHAKFIFSIRAGDEIISFNERHSPME